MAGDWIKVEAAMPDKPEVSQLAEILKIDHDAVVGKLIRLWIWADQQTVDGNAVGVTKTFIDRCTYCDGFADAMTQVGWIVCKKGALCFPNFDRLNGATAKKRALTAKRVKKCKENAIDSAESNAESVTEELPREEKRREEKKEEKEREENDHLFFAPSQNPKTPPGFRPHELVNGNGTSQVDAWINRLSALRVKRGLAPEKPNIETRTAMGEVIEIGYTIEEIEEAYTYVLTHPSAQFLRDNKCDTIRWVLKRDDQGLHRIHDLISRGKEPITKPLSRTDQILADLVAKGDDDDRKPVRRVV